MDRTPKLRPALVRDLQGQGPPWGSRAEQGPTKAGTTREPPGAGDTWARGRDGQGTRDAEGARDRAARGRCHPGKQTPQTERGGPPRADDTSARGRDGQGP